MSKEFRPDRARDSLSALRGIARFYYSAFPFGWAQRGR